MFHFKKGRGAVNLGWTSQAYLFHSHENTDTQILDTTAVVLDIRDLLFVFMQGVCRIEMLQYSSAVSMRLHMGKR